MGMVLDVKVKIVVIVDFVILRSMQVENNKNFKQIKNDVQEVLIYNNKVQIYKNENQHIKEKTIDDRVNDQQQKVEKVIDVIKEKIVTKGIILTRKNFKIRSKCTTQTITKLCGYHKSW